MKHQSVLVLLGILAASSVFAAAPPVKPNPAAAESVAFVFLGPEPHRTKRLARARQDLEVGALRAPREERTANVLLTRGLTGVGVQTLLAPRGMDLIAFEAKVPLPGPPNHMMTIWLESISLMIPTDSIEEMVDINIGRQRYQFMQRARQMGTVPQMQETAEEYRAVAMSHEFAAYRLEVVGTREALFSLLRDPTVYAVLVKEDEDAVEAFRRAKAEMHGRWVIRGPRVRMGPVDPNKPLPDMRRLPGLPPLGGEMAVAGEEPPIPEPQTTEDQR